jgi:hypothetical protein
MPSLPRWRSSWFSPRRLLPLVLGTAALGLVWGRFALESHRSVRDARVALAAGDRAQAVRGYRDALRVYVPGSPFEQQALDGLRTMADDAHRQGDALTERDALQAIRAGLLGTRSIVPPHRARLAEASARLEAMDAALGAAPPVALVLPHGHHGQGRLSDARGSAVLSTLIALVGLGTWIAAVALLVGARLQDRQSQDRQFQDRQFQDRQSPVARDAMAQTGSKEPGATSPAGPLRVLVPVLFAVGVALFLIGLGAA